ncbi:MAG: glycosyltransferase [Betaproteobacteria bacterium PRO3]|nr:glycosyltransferase [Betaproteobacteria bacterium PRO3]
MPTLEPRHLAPRADAGAMMTFSALVRAGALCGEAEARAELVSRAALLDAAPSALPGNASAVERDLAAARERIAELESSTSWRLTAPLRKALGRSRVTHARLQALPSAFRQLPRQASTAATILREQGPVALLRRVSDKLRGPGYVPPAHRRRYAMESAIAPLAFRPSASPSTTIVVPAYGEPLATFSCLKSVHATVRHDDVEVIVVDDASPEPLERALAPVTGVRFLRAVTNGGFIAACNLGAAQARGAHLVLLNNDTIVTAGWLDAIARTFERHSDAGLVGAKLVYPDGRLQEAGGIVWRDGSAWNHGRGANPDRPEFNYARRVDYCSGACLAIPRDLFASLGGFDAAYAPAYYEDTDLAFKVRAAGRSVWYQPGASVVHFEGTTSGTDETAGAKRHQATNRAVFAKRWADVLARHRSNGDAPSLEADRAARARVLVIDANMLTPDRDSGSMRMQAILELLVELGAKATFVADNLEFREPYVSALREAGVEVWSRPWVRSIPELLAKRGREFDVVVLSRHYVAAKHLASVRRFAPRARVVFDTVDLHFLRNERRSELEAKDGAPQPASDREREQELDLVRRADLTLVVSPVERDLLARLVPSARVEVLTNIHEPRSRGKTFAQRRGIVFIGSFRHPPNADAVAWYAREVLPLLRARMPGVATTIVGADPPASVRALAAPDLVIAGYVEDLDPLFGSARVSVAPLRYGAGVKGKVNLAMSYGVPVVARKPSPTRSCVRTTTGRRGCSSRRPASPMSGATSRARPREACSSASSRPPSPSPLPGSRAASAARSPRSGAGRALRRRSVPPEHEVEHRVAELQAPRLELRLRPPGRTRRVALGGVREQRLRRERGEHLLGVRRPVGRGVQIAARREPQRERMDERGLQQTALVVALLRPGIGKVDVDARERGLRNHRVDHLHGIVLDHAQVRERALLDAVEDRAHARAVHLDADEVEARLRRGDRGGRLAHAAADLEHDGRPAAERSGEVDRRLRERQAEARCEVLERSRLRRRQAALAQHETADRTMMHGPGRVGAAHARTSAARASRLPTACARRCGAGRRRPAGSRRRPSRCPSTGGSRRSSRRSCGTRAPW